METPKAMVQTLKERGWVQKQIAQYLDTTQSVVSRIMNGGGCSWKTYQKLTNLVNNQLAATEGKQ